MNVPNCTINDARLSVSGSDRANHVAGQHYYIDGEEASGCDLKYYYGTGAWDIIGISCGNTQKNDPDTSWVEVNPVDITKNIPSGSHAITASGIDNKHTMVIEAITTPSSKPMVLYNTDKTIWVVDEESKSLDELYALIQPTNATPKMNTTA